MAGEGRQPLTSDLAVSHHIAGLVYVSLLLIGITLDCPPYCQRQQTTKAASGRKPPF